MLYLAEKHRRFMPAGAQGRKELLEWLFWQVGNRGPMAGQYSHFVNSVANGREHAGARDGDGRRCG